MAELAYAHDSGSCPRKWVRVQVPSTALKRMVADHPLQIVYRIIFQEGSKDMAEQKKNILTSAGLKKLEDELNDLRVFRRREVAQKIKEAREQGDLSENAEYDAAKDEQRDIEARIEEIEKILKNSEVIDEDSLDKETVNFGGTVHIQDIDSKEEYKYMIVGSTEADVLNGKISNESPIGKALIGRKAGQTVIVNTPSGTFNYKILDFTRG